MDCKELKQAIIDNKPITFPLAMKSSYNTKFVCMQYAKAIVGSNDVKYINSLSEIMDDNSFFDSVTYYLYVTEKLGEQISQDYDNLIVIYGSVDKDIEEPEHIDMPELLDWQVLDFAKMRLPGVKESDVEWLCKQAKYDIYRIDSECDKIAIFNKNDQQLVFNQLKDEGGYMDLTEFNIFDFCQAFDNHDLDKMAKLMKQAEVVDIEPTAVVTIVKRQVKKYMDLQMNPKATPEDCGMTVKQFYYLKNHPKFSNRQLIKLYDELTAIDYKIKSGNLDLRGYETDGMINTQRLAYIVCKILSC